MLLRVTREIRMRFEKQPTGGRKVRLFAYLLMLAVPVLGWTAAGQDKIVKAYLEAAASGQPEALLQFFHPGEVEDLRRDLLKTLQDEAAHGSSTVRERLFGSSSIEEISHLTPNNLFITVARRLGLPAERVGEIKVVGIVDENSQLSHAVARIAPPPNSDLRSRVALVSLVRYGKDWRVAIPSGFQARLEAATAAPAAAAAAGSKTSSKTTNTPEILAFLADGSATLRKGDCAGFFNERMSPNFRSMKTPKAMETLIDQCMTYEDTRETYISALELARRMTPAYEQDGTRAIYDLRGQGLPFDRFVLEKVENRWYVAE
jgi:hypothetical protein